MRSDANYTASSFKPGNLRLVVSSQANDGARRAVGTHHGPTWPTTAYAIGGTAALALRYSIISALAAARTRLRDDCWPPGAVGVWAPPPHPPGPQDLPRYYGQDGAAGGLSRSTPRQADDATTRPSGAGRHVSHGPTTGSQNQATCYVRRGTGPVVHCSIIAHFFFTEYTVGTKPFKGRSFNVIFFASRRYVLNQQ